MTEGQQKESDMTEDRDKVGKTVVLEVNGTNPVVKVLGIYNMVLNQPYWAKVLF